MLPETLDGLFVLLAGVLAWLVAGALNKNVTSPDPRDQSRKRAIVSLVALVAWSVVFYLALIGIRRGPFIEADFMVFTGLAFSSQKAFFMLTDSILGIDSGKDDRVLDTAERKP